MEIEVKNSKLQLAKEEFFFTTIFAQFLTEQKKKKIISVFHAPVTKGDVSSPRTWFEANFKLEKYCHKLCK